MLKFLRKYNKWILVVFGGLLMIVFLVPTTIQEISRQSAALGGTWAHAGSSKVTEADRMRVAGQLQTLDTLERGLGVPVLMQLRSMTGLDPRDPTHWYLLVREAEDAGFIGGAAEGRLWIQEQLASSGTVMSEAELLGQLAGNSRQSPTQVLEALGNARGVLRMLQVAGALPISDSRAKIAISEMQTSASADVVVLDAARPLASNEPPAPSTEALQAHFDKYSDKVPGEGDSRFGYRVPDRVKLEWFRIPAESVRASLEGDPRLSELELRKAYLRDPSAFFPPGVDGSSPDFDGVATQVRQSMVDRLTRERLAEIERFVEDQFALALRGVPKTGGYYDLTPEQLAAQPAFAKLVATISEQFKIPVPEYHGAGDEWLLPADANKIAQLGTAMSTRFGPQARRLSNLLAVLREFGGSGTMLVQKGVTGPPLAAPSFSGGPSDVFFFRVVDAQPSHAPAMLDEVADAVRSDLLRIARYEVLAAQAPAIEQQAVTNGLSEVATAFGTTVQFMPRISETMPANIPGVGQDPEVIREIMKRAIKMPKTVPLADVPDAERTFVVKSPEKLAVLVVRLTSLKPLAAEDFEKLASAGSLRRSIGTRVPTIMLDEIYGIEPLKKRHDFKLARETTDAP